MDKVIEGKTKIIWKTVNEGEVLVESKDDITAGDGTRHDVIPDKARLATETTVNVFELLEKKGIPTHFLKRMSETSFLALSVNMIPIEIVTRRVAFGSYLKRNPDVEPKTHFDELVVELYDKDDAAHDPFLELDETKQVVVRHTANKPIGEHVIDEHAIDTDDRFRTDTWPALRSLAQEAFTVIERAWSARGISLVDMKIECGITPDGRIVIADVIDNDSWRIWPDGESSKMMDKQLYRDHANLAEVAENYAKVAEMTKKFQ